ncbi:MAG: DUF3179 domain-containing (seleno)protein [Flavobacteriaceae bacterium]
MRRQYILCLLLLNIGWGLAQRPIAHENGKIFVKDGSRLLYGGKENQHFVIDNLELAEEQFHYGIGREQFPALLEPAFESVSSAQRHWNDNDRFLVAHVNNEVKAYSVQDLTRHEVVNDVVGGEAVFAAYCILADLGALYKRTYGEKTLTFAVSGYTYFDPDIWEGLDGFILWDRETESLWWPLIDKAVSGSLKGVKLRKLEGAFWEDTNWQTIRVKYPSAMVLVPNQDFERPVHWKRIEDVSDIVKKYGH